MDERDPTKRRHFEISIDSPFHLLSCKATQANICLPAYTSPDSEPMSPIQGNLCGCPRPTTSRRDGASDSEESVMLRSFTSGSGGLALPQQAHLVDQGPERIQRPMHLLRLPSYAPPAFEDVPPPPPPPLVTPPPEYTSIVGENDRESVLEDYFHRLSSYEEHADDERGRGRVDVPLTPGARINRSMDVPRDWVRLEAQ